MATSVEGVLVKVGRMEDDWRKFAIIVQVRSLNKPHLKASKEIDPGKCLNQAELLKAVAVAAGLCSEYLGKKYGENQNPGLCVIYSQRAFLEEMRLMAELKKDAPEKIKRLKNNSSILSGAETTLLDRLDWLVKRGESLTLQEGQALDVMVGRLHSNQL